MSLLYATGFDYFAAATDLTEAGWQQNGAQLIESGTCSAFSRQCIAIDSNYYAITPRHLIVDEGPMFFSMWFKYNYTLSADENIFVFRNFSGSDELQIYLDTNEALYFANALGTQLGSKSSNNVCPKDTWVHLEIKAQIANSIPTDSCIIKVDGNQEINLPATTDTCWLGNENISGFKLVSDSTIGHDVFLDDLVIWDSSGSDWNDFKGVMYISTLKPNGVGNYSQWTRSGGSNNYEMVDEDEYDDDTTYVTTSTLSNRDSYDYENLNAAVDSIKAVCLTTVGTKSAGTALRTINGFSRISSTDYDHDWGYTLDDDNYRVHQNIWEESPATATAWTPAEINGAEFGVKVKK